MNKLRVPLIRQSFTGARELSLDNPTPLKGVSVLDVGCGGGILSEVCTPSFPYSVVCSKHWSLKASEYCEHETYEEQMMCVTCFLQVSKCNA